MPNVFITTEIFREKTKKIKYYQTAVLKCAEEKKFRTTTKCEEKYSAFIVSSSRINNFYYWKL